MNGNEKIQVTHLTKTFRQNTVLNDITFSVQCGEILGLLGPSGAGKTTLVKILTGQLAPTQGEVRLHMEAETDVTARLHVEAETDVTARLYMAAEMGKGKQDYRRIGMVMDEAGLYERLSCWDNLLLFAQLYGVSHQRITELLERVSLQEAVRCPVSKLSKGMRQRLVLARALLHEPEMLFLDEPTSGLDPTTAARIHTLILEEQKKGTTIFLTTHNMEEATKLCDNVALLHKGTIVEYGNPKEVCRRYNHQNQIVILKKDGEWLRLKNDAAAAETLADCLRANLIESIHSTEPNLETVFMELTGRGLEN